MEINKSEIADNTRIDAELYDKYLVFLDKRIRNLDHTTLQLESSVLKKGIFDIKAECYTSVGVPFIRISNLRDMIVDEEGIAYIPPSEHIKNEKTALHYGDVVLSKTANAAASFVNLPECNASQDTVVLKLKADTKILSEYLVAFLNTDFGLKSMQRWFTGNIQTHLNLDDAKAKIPIPVFSDPFQNGIKQLFHFYLKNLNASKEKYLYATKFLLEELGLSNWKIPETVDNTKYFSSSYLKTGRLDAEYYQPKYDELLGKLSNFETDILDNLVTIKKSIEPGSEAYISKGIPFIRVANLSKYGISKSNIYLNKGDYDYEELMPKKDTILLSKDGTVGIAHKLEEDREIITSGAILHLRVRGKEVLPDYLCLVLNSIIVQLQAERDAGGSIIQHWKPDEIKQVVIPKLPIPIQEAIVDIIKSSFLLQKIATDLLEKIKFVVLTAIEENEENGFNLLSEILRKYGC